MRISMALLLFFVLFNSWGGLMQQYGIDDQLGINAETGDAEELNQAVNSTDRMKTGSAIGGTLLGYYNALAGTIEGILLGLNPGLQLLTNVLPPGMPTALVKWAFGILQIIIAVDLYSYYRGVDL